MEQDRTSPLGACLYAFRLGGLFRNMATVEAACTTPQNAAVQQMQHAITELAGHCAYGPSGLGSKATEPGPELGPAIEHLKVSNKKSPARRANGVSGLQLHVFKY